MKGINDKSLDELSKEEWEELAESVVDTCNYCKKEFEPFKKTHYRLDLVEKRPDEEYYLPVLSNMYCSQKCLRKALDIGSKMLDSADTDIIIYDTDGTTRLRKVLTEKDE